MLVSLDGKHWALWLSYEHDEKPFLQKSIQHQRYWSALQSQEAVTAHLKSKQLRPFGFACQHCVKRPSNRFLLIGIYRFRTGWSRHIWPMRRHMWRSHWFAMTDGVICRPRGSICLLSFQPSTYLVLIFTHLKLCLADAIHNFKWVTIIQIW